jgi:5-methylcytosine-specific restriction endonuclease McrA
MDKICTKCKDVLPINFFDSRGAGRWQSQCKNCRRKWVNDNKSRINARRRKWNFSNKIARKKRQKAAKEYYKRNAEKLIKYSKQWYHANKEYAHQRDHKYYTSHRDIILKKKLSYRKDNRQKDADASKKYRKEHPETVRALGQKRRANEAQVSGSHTGEEWLELKIAYGYTCPSCLKKEPEILLTVDHVIPISKNGSNNIDNIQPLCKSCNSSKGTKTKLYSVP